MKKLLLTTGLASAVLFSANAMAEVKVGAVLEWNIGSSEVASTGTKDSGPTAIGFSTELDISSNCSLICKFHRYLCKSGIAILELRITRN